MLADIDLDNTTSGLSIEEKKSFWLGIARLSQADPTTKKPRFNAVLREYVGNKDNRAMIMALGQIEDMPPQVLAPAFFKYADWKRDIPRVVADRLVGEERWDNLLANVSEDLAAELRYARSSTRVASSRYDRARTYEVQPGPTAPNLPNGITHEVLGFVNDAVREPLARLGWLGAGLLGWGDLANPVTRTLATKFPDGRPRAVEGFVTMGHGLRTDADRIAQRTAVIEFLQAHPHFRRYYSKSAGKTFDYDPNGNVYVDPDVTLNFDDPTNPNYYLHSGNRQYWRRPKWDGSHLGAHSFGFATNADNLIALPRRVNTSYFGYYEEIVRDLHQRFGKVYLRVEVLEYDPHGLARVVRFQAFVPDAHNRPVRVLSEDFITDYMPGMTKVKKQRDIADGLREMDDAETIPPPVVP